LKNIIFKIAALYLLIIIISSSFVYGIEEEADPEVTIEEPIEEVYIEPIPPEDTNFEEYNLNYLRLEENGEPKIYSESAILMEASTGNILAGKDYQERKYPASLTKILTAIIVLEKCDLDEMVTVSENSVNSIKSGYASSDMVPGEQFTVREVLDVMMLHSANDCAIMLAEHVSGSVEEFAKLMNEKAREIGCKNSNFVNPNGVHDENHYSTAYDMAQIAKYCMKNEEFRKIVCKSECSLPDSELYTKEEPRIYKNTNKLMIHGNRYYYKYCNGIKTGFTTPAKNCMISSANKDGFELICIVLHAERTDNGLSARYLDTINLFNYWYQFFNLEDIKKLYEQNDNTPQVISPEKELVEKFEEDSIVTESKAEDSKKESEAISKINALFGGDVACIVIGAFLLIVGISILLLIKINRKNR